MIWGLTLLIIYIARKYKADHEELDKQHDIDQRIE